MAKKPILEVRDYVYDDTTKAHIKALKEENIKNFLDYYEATEEYITNAPIFTNLGTDSCFKYFSLFVGERNVGYFGYFLTTGVLDIQEFFIEPEYKTTANIREIVKFLKGLGKEFECKNISVRTFYDKKIASILALLKAKSFIITYKLGVE